MIKKLFFILFIFLVNCSVNKTNPGISNNQTSQEGVNISIEYSFEEYVNLLSKKSTSKEYPDINIFPD